VTVIGRYGSGVLRRGMVGAGALAMGAAVVLVLLPLHHAGVSGNAAWPTYTSFGWFAYSPLPEHSTPDELRAAGAHVSYVDGSHHAVRQRRRIAGIVGGAGVALIAGGLLFGRRQIS
jgi:hypothetical protein